MAYKQESVTIHLLKHYTLTIGKPPQFLILQSALPCKAEDLITVTLRKML